MCMKNYNDEKIMFDKFTAFFSIVIFEHCLYNNGWKCIFCEINISKGFQYFFSILCRPVPHILKMGMKNCDTEKLISDKFTAFFNIAIF